MHIYNIPIYFKLQDIVFSSIFQINGQNKQIFAFDFIIFFFVSLPATCGIRIVLGYNQGWVGRVSFCRAATEQKLTRNVDIRYRGAEADRAPTTLAITSPFCYDHRNIWILKDYTVTYLLLYRTRM